MLKYRGIRKLKYNIAQATADGCKTLLTFGGAFSNHIAATAAAGKLCGFKTIGIIRGEELGVDLAQTLKSVRFMVPQGGLMISWRVKGLVLQSRCRSDCRWKSATLVKLMGKLVSKYLEQVGRMRILSSSIMLSGSSSCAMSAGEPTSATSVARKVSRSCSVRFITNTPLWYPPHITTRPHRWLNVVSMTKMLLVVFFKDVIMVKQMEINDLLQDSLLFKAFAVAWRWHWARYGNFI